MRRVEDELHRLQVAMLDRSNPDFQKFWAAQQALSWVLDPETFAPPFGSLKSSEATRADCSAHSSQS